MIKRKITNLPTKNNNNDTMDELSAPINNELIYVEDLTEKSDEDKIKSVKRMKILKICNLDTEKTCFDLHLRILKVHSGKYTSK